MPMTKVKRKKVIRVYPRELLQTEGISTEVIEMLRRYSAEKRRQILEETITEADTVEPTGSRYQLGS